MWAYTGMMAKDHDTIRYAISKKMPIIRMDNQSISYSSYDVFMDLGGNISLTSFI